MVIDATRRFACQHELVGQSGFFKCSKCSFQVSELPLSMKSTADVYRMIHDNGRMIGEKLYKSA